MKIIKPVINERRLTILVFSLFFAWLLSIPFEGEILYTLIEITKISYGTFLIFGSIFFHFIGLIVSSLIIKTKSRARLLMLISIIYCMIATTVFFMTPSVLWIIAVLSGSFLTGSCVAGWAFFLKNSTHRSERIKIIADSLIGSNVLMILINMTAVHVSVQTGLIFSIGVLILALLFASMLPKKDDEKKDNEDISIPGQSNVIKPLALLCLFIVILTISSGLMYQVQGPAYSHLRGLTSWYWAIPYIIALLVMRNLPKKFNRTYILYVAIAMIGLSYIAFMIFEHNVISYFIVNTLILGACGIYDLFWWSILGEMLDWHRNPSRILGIGLSSNVLGLLVGGVVGRIMIFSEFHKVNTVMVVFVVVCISIILLPILNKHLLVLLNEHAYLNKLLGMPDDEQNKIVKRFMEMGHLTARECEIASLLIKGKTYRMISHELSISENTVKTHIKNIYSKLNIKSRSDLMNVLISNEILTN